jgi:16S rRNA (guanine1516-N2)-methyltransferase
MTNFAAIDFPPADRGSIRFRGEEGPKQATARMGSSREYFTWTHRPAVQDESLRNTRCHIGITCRHAGSGPCKAGMKLAADLRLDLVDRHSQHFPLLLIHTDFRLELQQSGPEAPGPVYADFTGATLRYRLQHGGSRRQMLARALGLKPGFSPHILDATAGLGRDGFVLAALGCHVLMIERNPVIAALLRDGLQRAGHQRETAVIMERIRFVEDDSLFHLPAYCQQIKAQAIYLDPMYPVRIKSALVKKEMRLLRLAAGDDPDAPVLLEAALDQQVGRVVVKRPRLAPPLGGHVPTFTIRGKSSRYDIYLTGEKAIV